MIKHLLNFKFKTARKYIHGPDIYSNIESVITSNYNLNDVEKFTLSIVKSSNQNQIIILSSNKNDLNDVDFCCRFQFSLRGGEVFFGALSNSGSAVSDYYDYDESYYVKNAIINEDSINLSGAIPHSTVEAIVALNKNLLSKICDFDGKWIITRLDTEGLLTDRDEVKNIRIKANKYDSPRLTKSEIFINERKSGFIYFSNVKNF